MIWRMKFAYLVISSQKIQEINTALIDNSLTKVCDLLLNARDEVKNQNLILDLDYCLNVIASKANYTIREKPKMIKTEDSSSSLDKISISNNKLSTEEIKLNIQKALENYDIADDLNLNEQTVKILEQAQDFEFDIFKLHKETNGNEMITLATYLTHKHDLFVKLAIEPNTFSKFIRYIQNGYNDVAYHNKIHGMDVGRLAYYYGTSCELLQKADLSDLELFWLILGGAIHDFEHLGWNNAYLIETQHEWAITYNDISVCENHHVAAAFEVMKNRQGCNIFEHTSHEEFKKLRKKITKMVIATDMALHFEYLEKFKTFLTQKEINYNEDNKTFLMWMTLHISDLTNPAKQWYESYKWSWLVYEEFFVQGDKEKELFLPIGPLNNRDTINMADSQVGFISFIIQPTFEAFVEFLPKVRRNVDQLLNNKEKWRSLIEECKEIKNEGNDLIKLYNQLDSTQKDVLISNIDCDQIINDWKSDHHWENLKNEVRSSEINSKEE